MNLSTQLKIINEYITVFHPLIHEITSLEEVLVVAYNGYFIFGYGDRGIIAIKPRRRRIFDGENFTVINNG